MSYNDGQKALRGKLLITGTLKVLTGMHIGGGDDFAPIGSVDSPFIRDTLTHEPIIPGSSLKGKIRTLLARSMSESYLLQDISKDPVILKRMFGSAKPVMPSRLQFFDLFANKLSKEKFENIETDTYLGEVKCENTISRTSCVANPRQIERVPAGLEFDCRIVYNIENTDEAKEDIKKLFEGLNLLEMDYLGGHGSRGYGRVVIENLRVAVVGGEGINADEFEVLLK